MNNVFLVFCIVTAYACVGAIFPHCILGYNKTLFIHSDAQKRLNSVDFTVMVAITLVKQKCMVIDGKEILPSSAKTI